MSVSVEHILVGDIGATNARFTLLSNRNLTAISSFEVAKFEQFADVLAIFIKEHCRQTQIHQVLLAIAGPVKSERVALTNSSWVIDIRELQTVFGLQVRIINDFEAVALSLPSLTTSTDLAEIGGGKSELGAPMAVLGPGTVGAIFGGFSYTKPAVSITPATPSSTRSRCLALCDLRNCIVHKAIASFPVSSARRRR